MQTATRQTKVATMERTMDVRMTEFGLACTVLEYAHKKRVCNLTTKSYLLRAVGTEIEVENLTDGGKYHLKSGNGVISCDCPAGNYRGKCRHEEMVKQARQQGLI